MQTVCIQVCVSLKERLPPCTAVKLAGYTGQTPTLEIKPVRSGFHVEAHV